MLIDEETQSLILLVLHFQKGDLADIFKLLTAWLPKNLAELLPDQWNKKNGIKN